MANLTHWRSPFDEFQRFYDDINRFFGRSLAESGQGLDLPFFGHRGPAVDLSETQNEIVLHAEIPGVNPDDLDITITEDSITLRGEVKQEINADERGYRRVERRYGSFYRSIPFPSMVKHDQATASYRNGILEVRIPKAEEAKSKATKLRVSPEPKQLQ